MSHSIVGHSTQVRIGNFGQVIRPTLTKLSSNNGEETEESTEGSTKDQ